MFNSNLSFSERERICYIQGNLNEALSYHASAELEEEIDNFDTRLDEANKEGYEEAKKELIGVDAVKQISDLTIDLKRSVEELYILRNLLRSFTDVFHLDGMKTVAGRKLIKSDLNQKITGYRY